MYTRNATGEVGDIAGAVLSQGLQVLQPNLLAKGRKRAYDTRLAISVTFWPPKPKLFERATSQRVCRAVLGT